MIRILTQLALAACFFIATAANAVTINFSAPLTVIDIDEGGGLYSGSGTTDVFTGNIDNPGAFGAIAINGNGLTVNFTCCIDAGGLDFSNDGAIDAEVAGNLNLLTGTTDFMDGMVFDSSNLEGDATVEGDGRIEIGMSFLFSPDTYTNEGPGNTLDPNDAFLTVFFILEENALGGDIFAAVGLVNYSGIPTPVPVPATVWLFGSALGLLGWMRRRA